MGYRERERDKKEEPGMASSFSSYHILQSADAVLPHMKLEISPTDSMIPV